MTKEEIQSKADELSIRENCKVHPLVFQDLNDVSNVDAKVIGYVKEPNRMTKLRYMDKALIGSSSAGAEVVDSHLLLDVSDPRILKEDTYYLGAVNALNSIITLAVDQFKKK